ncbi:MAG TPA: GntR family transcriptional regulator [Anaerolineae bacterium]
MIAHKRTNGPARSVHLPAGSDGMMSMATRERRTNGTLAPGDRRIDRDAFEPPYHQLAAILRHQISSGRLRPGDKLPSEAQLCEHYEVSPMTVRRALNILLDEGLVTASRGRGTFVKPLVLGAATFGLQALEDLFSREDTLVRFLSVRIRSATPRISRNLGVAVDERVIAIRRLLCRQAEPIAIHREYLLFDAARPIVEAEMGITSLQGLFDGRGETVLKRGDLAIETTTITEDEARILLVPAGKAAFRIEHTFYDFDERPVSWGWFIVRGDCLRFNASVGAQTPQR